MSLRKFKAIWPLPGGMRSYVLTLKEILDKISEENPTMDKLTLWFKDKYNWSDGPVRYGLRIISKCLGFMQEVEGRVKLTSAAEEFLKTNDNGLVLDALRRRVLGFEEILSMFAESHRLSLMEIHNGLLERCNPNWKTSTQPIYRLNWLISLGFVDREQGKYYLTDEGLKAIYGEEAKKPLLPVTVTVAPIVTPTPVEKYISHAIASIKKHPTMSETNTTYTLIDPLLEVLGWNIRDPDEVQREYPIRIGERTEYVDIALKINNRPVVFIEAKAVDSPLQDHLAEQPIKYANAEGVSWCILTNGRELRVYNAFWKIRGIEQKMLFKLSIDEFKEKIDKLELLSKGNIASGKIDEEGEFEHAKRIASEWFKQKENNIVKGIMELDPSLKEEYVRKVLRKIL